MTLNRTWTKKIGDDMSVSRGRDGHWMTFRHGRKEVSINVENTMAGDKVAMPTILLWIDHELTYACNHCQGHGDSNDSKEVCPECLGIGTLLACNIDPNDDISIKK